MSCGTCVHYLKEQFCYVVKDDKGPDGGNDCKHYKAATNSDKINAMSFEEKVRFFAEVSRCAGCPPGNPMDCMDSCAKCWEDYLKKTVEG